MGSKKKKEEKPQMFSDNTAEMNSKNMTTRDNCVGVTWPLERDDLVGVSASPALCGADELVGFGPELSLQGFYRSSL